MSDFTDAQEQDWVALYGPCGVKVARCIARCERLTELELARLIIARRAAGDIGYGKAMDAALATNRTTAWDAALFAAMDAKPAITPEEAWLVLTRAVMALVMEDAIPVETFRAMTQPWRAALDEEPGTDS